jgi:hypothetical protein
VQCDAIYGIEMALGKGLERGDERQQERGHSGVNDLRMRASTASGFSLLPARGR